MRIKISKKKLLILFAILIVACMAFVFTVTSYSGNIKYEHPEGYIQSIDPASYEKYDVDIPWTIKKYELITIDAAKFKQNTENGKMEFNLVGKSFILEMETGIWVNEGIKEYYDDENGTTVEREMEPIYQYSGKVANQPESEVTFTLDKQTVLGWIIVDGDQYVIEQRGWVMDNNTKKTVYITYKESDIESIGYDINTNREPLLFTVSNEDVYSHTVVVEIFDSSETSIFTDEYTLEPGQFMVSPSIIDETNDGDTYIYEATLENNMTKTYKFTVDSDAAASIDIYNESESSGAYIEFGCLFF